MSSSIWTQSAASSRIRRLSSVAWRVVEAQHRNSTRNLVGSDEEQILLEDLLEAAKPPLSEQDGRLHYLLFTPFRYPPLAHGSRFGSRWDRGIWYGAEALRSAFAEVAYYRLLFLEGTDADLGTIETELTAFNVPILTSRGIDLASAAFERWRPQLASKTSYTATQPLGVAMRDAGVEACRYDSARDDEGGVNVAVFSPRAFAARRPRSLQSWYSAANRDAVEFSKQDYFEQQRYRFVRAVFLVDGALPHPVS
jgi:hypothetical protein